MNEDIIKGQWHQLKGQLQKQWGKLTDDDIDIIKGSSTELEGKIQERYGITREEAKAELKKFVDSV
ncbi:MAG: CsbD family protein [Gammaproteobacteria bacterium]|nr:CsbD family protein [Gammaproteobacteria bacterium]